MEEYVFERTNGSNVGVGKNGKNDHAIEYNGKIKWFQTPKELGNKKVNVIKKVITKCVCEKHDTELYTTEKNLTVNYCNYVKQYLWQRF